MRKFHRRARHDRGAVAVEFALILPVLLLIVVGTIEFGRVYSQLQVYNGAAREGARCAAVMASEVADCNTLTDVQTRINDASDPYPNPPAATITPSGGCTDSTIGEDVTVQWNQPMTLDIPFWNDISFTSTIEAVFRCE